MCLSVKEETTRSKLSQLIFSSPGGTTVLLIMDTIWEHSDVFPHLRYMKGWDFMHYGIEKSYGNVILVGLERVQLTHVILVETPNR